MKSLRNLAGCAIACALVSAAPTRGVVQETSPTPPSQNPGNPKWVESMQRLVKDLTDENLKLRRAVEDLQDSNNTLMRQLTEARRLEKENRGVVVVPPDALRVAPAPPNSGTVPPNWKPFEFNGATYYMIPLDQRATPGTTPATARRLTLPEAKK